MFNESRVIATLQRLSYLTWEIGKHIANINLDDLDDVLDKLAALLGARDVINTDGQD